MSRLLMCQTMGVGLLMSASVHVSLRLRLVTHTDTGCGIRGQKSGVHVLLVVICVLQFMYI